jgi:hypothetical protein
MTSTPCSFAREDTTVLEHEGTDLLTMNPKGLNPGGASPNEISHRFMAFIGHPYWSEFAGTQELGQRHSITAVCLYPVAGLPRKERRRHNRARLAKLGDEPV